MALLVHIASTVKDGGAQLACCVALSDLSSGFESMPSLVAQGCVALLLLRVLRVFLLDLLIALAMPSHGLLFCDCVPAGFVPLFLLPVWLSC